MSAVDRASYDELYRSAPEGVWSGRPNHQLVVAAEGLRPGRALDAGSGEGGDALWLAERGWQVTAVDFSAVAVERAAARARARGLGDRVEWLHADLDTWTPPGRFDLVTAHYLHARWTDRPGLFRRLAAAVAPGGSLLVVGHSLGDGPHGHAHGHAHGQHDHGQHDHGQHDHGQHDHGQHDHGQHGRLAERDLEAFYTAEEIAALLDPGAWRDVVTETRERDPGAAERTGNPAPDTVLRARRSGAR